MSDNQLDFLKKTGRYLWRLVIVDNSFMVGSYLLVVSVIMLLVARVFGVAFLSESYLLLISPLIGLAGGAIIGLFNKPALTDVALVIDSKSGSNNYFSTAYECSEKQYPNPVEDALVKGTAAQGRRAALGFTFRYNWRYFYLFTILSGVLMVIWFTPVAKRSPPMLHRGGVSAPVFETDIITISQGLSGVKDKTQENYLAQEFIRDIEALLDNINDNQQDKTVLLEKANEFLQDLPGLELPARESARLRALLEKLASLSSEMPVSLQRDKNKTVSDNTFSSYQSGHSRAADSSASSQVRPDKDGQARPDMVLKTREEAINNPYFPEEYKEIVKKYFEQRD